MFLGKVNFKKCPPILDEVCISKVGSLIKWLKSIKFKYNLKTTPSIYKYTHPQSTT